MRHDHIVPLEPKRLNHYSFYSSTVLHHQPRSRPADPKHPTRRLQRLRTQQLLEEVRAERIVPTRRRRYPRRRRGRSGERLRGHVRAGRGPPLRLDRGPGRAARLTGRHQAAAGQVHRIE